MGSLAETIPLIASNKVAKARARGAKMVVVDPVCTNAAAKADEWIPIKPGTDAALALSMLNLLLNEYGLYDRWFLKTHTNGIYLVKPDGHYLRDPLSSKPLVWDLTDQMAKTYDDETLSDPAIEGTYEVTRISCQPAFQKLKDHVKQFDPTWASQVTTIPEKVIRRFAREFGEAARIGSTIDIDGVQMPYRPAGIDFKRGVGAHRGGGLTCFAVQLLNIVVGAIDVPGSQRGVNPIGPFWTAEKGKDGLIEPAEFITKYNKPYPGGKARSPQSLDLREIFPASLFTRGMYPFAIDHQEELKIPYKPEMILHARTNLMMNSHNPEAMAATLKKIPFIVSFAVQLDETSEFADIVLPDAHDFERHDFFSANDPYAFITPGPGEWFWLLRQPVVNPPEKVRPWGTVLLEIAERLGILENLYEVGNVVFNLGPSYKLDPKKKYSIPEIAERQAKTIVGPDFSLGHFKDSSCVITRKKTIEEAYPRPFLKARVPIYLEYLLKVREDVQEVMSNLGFPWNYEGYQPLPMYIPCQSNIEDPKEFDLLGANFKVPFHTFSISGQNLWIDEISVRHPFAYRILLHTETAKKKGIKDGDLVWVESRYGKIKGRCRVTECIHPECVGIGGTFGHWAKKMPTARDKGAHYNTLLPNVSLERFDTLTGAIDQCIRVKVYPA
jgi:molybdopterin-containing oxidoreductase family molybdopterin binding subunit